MVQETRVMEELKRKLDLRFGTGDLHSFDPEAKAYRFQWVKKRLQGKEVGTAVDVGSGTGTLVNMLKGMGYDAMGVEKDKLEIEKAKRNVPGAEFVQEFPKDKKFDVVTALEVVEHLEKPQALVNDMLDALKPGGVLLVSVPVGKNYNCPDHKQYFNFHSLSALFEGYEHKICKIHKIMPMPGQSRRLFGVEVTNNVDD